MVRASGIAAARAGSGLSDADVELAARVCRRLDGLPLALELAGAQLRSLSLPELAARLDRPFELLERGRSSRRQSSLLAGLEGTWRLFNATEQELLRQLAAFASRFELDAAEQMIGDLPVPAVPNAFAGLTDRSRGLRLVGKPLLICRLDRTCAGTCAPAGLARISTDQ